MERRSLPKLRMRRDCKNEWIAIITASRNAADRDNRPPSLAKMYVVGRARRQGRSGWEGDRAILLQTAQQKVFHVAVSYGDHSASKTGVPDHERQQGVSRKLHAGLRWHL